MEVITPISKHYNKKQNSKRDYEEQWLRTNDGHAWMWDDSKLNQARVGQRFGFVFNGIHVIWHTIAEVHHPSQRLESWASNVGHGDRNVLVLSEPVATETWEQWTTRMHYSPAYIVRGTTYVTE
jgi:hypothetical protein